MRSSSTIIVVVILAACAAPPPASPPASPSEPTPNVVLTPGAELAPSEPQYIYRLCREISGCESGFCDPVSGICLCFREPGVPVTCATGYAPCQECEALDCPFPDSASCWCIRDGRRAEACISDSTVE